MKTIGEIKEEQLKKTHDLWWGEIQQLLTKACESKQPPLMYCCDLVQACLDCWVQEVGKEHACIMGLEILEYPDKGHAIFVTESTIDTYIPLITIRADNSQQTEWERYGGKKASGELQAYLRNRRYDNKLHMLLENAFYLFIGGLFMRMELKLVHWHASEVDVQFIYRIPTPEKQGHGVNRVIVTYHLDNFVQCQKKLSESFTDTSAVIKPFPTL